MEVNKIAIIHPSRGRPKWAKETYNNFVSKAKSIPISYYLSLDEDDKDLENYIKEFAGEDVKIIISKNTRPGSVEPTNAVQKHLKDESLILGVNDDFVPMENWDEPLINFINNAVATKEYFVHVRTSANNFRPECSECCIISRAFIDKLGFILYPEYWSMWADNDLTSTAKAFGFYYAFPEYYMRHENPAQPDNNTPMDDTYRRTGSQEAFDIGKKIYEKRLADNFGV